MHARTATSGTSPEVVPDVGYHRPHSPQEPRQLHTSLARHSGFASRQTPMGSHAVPRDYAHSFCVAALNQYSASLALQWGLPVQSSAKTPASYKSTFDNAYMLLLIVAPSHPSMPQVPVDKALVPLLTLLPVN